MQKIILKLIEDKLIRFSFVLIIVSITLLAFMKDWKIEKGAITVISNSTVHDTVLVPFEIKVIEHDTIISGVPTKETIIHIRDSVPCTISRIAPMKLMEKCMAVFKKAESDEVPVKLMDSVELKVMAIPDSVVVQSMIRDDFKDSIYSNVSKESVDSLK